MRTETKGRRKAMDFYSNDFVAQAESRRRQADLRGDARWSVVPAPAKTGDSRHWTSEFTAWVVGRARIGETFMSRTPMNP